MRGNSVAAARSEHFCDDCTDLFSNEDRIANEQLIRNAKQSDSVSGQVSCSFTLVAGHPSCLVLRPIELDGQS